MSVPQDGVHPDIQAGLHNLQGFLSWKPMDKENGRYLVGTGQGGMGQVEGNPGGGSTRGGTAGYTAGIDPRRP